MTNDRAIYLLGWLKCKTGREDDLEAIDKAIAALKRPSDGDLISRQDAIDAVTKHFRAHDNDLLEVIAYEIEQLPSAEPKTGRWLWSDGVRCSNCNHKLQTTGLPTVCPNCEAKMEVEHE